jgi:hypothetical protein
MGTLELVFIIVIMSLNPILFLVITIVEKRLDENSKFGKWWRSHVVGIEPKDDITE